MLQSTTVLYFLNWKIWIKAQKIYKITGSENGPLCSRTPIKNYSYISIYFRHTVRSESRIFWTLEQGRCTKKAATKDGLGSTVRVQFVYFSLEDVSCWSVPFKGVVKLTVSCSVLLLEFEPLLFYQVAPQFVLTRLSAPRSSPTTFFSGSAGNRTRASGSVAKNSDH
jgi:hypothetical protein